MNIKRYRDLLRSVGSALDISPGTNYVRKFTSNRDAYNLAQDWQQVGTDINRAMRGYGRPVNRNTGDKAD